MGSSEPDPPPSRPGGTQADGKINPQTRYQTLESGHCNEHSHSCHALKSSPLLEAYVLSTITLPATTATFRLYKEEKWDKAQAF